MAWWLGSREERRRRGWFGLQEQRAEARAIARANILHVPEPTPSPLAEPGTVIWRFDGRGWERWSDLWQAYEPGGEVPGTLPEQLAAEGVTPGVGDRFRFDGSRWQRLVPEDDEQSQAPPGDALPAPGTQGPAGRAPEAVEAATGSRREAPLTQPVREEPDRPSTEEMLEAWRRRIREG